MDREVLVAFGYHPPRHRVGHQKREAMARNVKQPGIAGRGDYVGHAWLTADCAQLAKKVAFGKRADLKRAFVGRMVVQVDSSAKDETQVKLVFALAADQFHA